MKRIFKFMGRRARFGRVAVPFWALSLAGLAVVAAAGQAVGPVLAGNVTGTANVTAQQSVVLATTTLDISNPSGDRGVVVINDNGTSFTAALEQHVGDRYQTLKLDVANNSNAAANAVLQLNVPSALDVGISYNVNDGEAMLSTNQDKTQQTFLLKVPTGQSTVSIEISSKDDAAPGTYTIAGSLVQIAG